jgi:hypothetical protein
VFPVRYELNVYIVFVFGMTLTINATVSLNSINQLVFVAET